MSFKNNAYNPQQIKNQIQNLSLTRQSIQKSKDISGSMVKLGETMKSLAPLMSKQTQYIKNFLQSQATSGNSSQESQIRRYANRIFDISINQINQILLQGQKYFTIDIKTSWKKIANEIEKQMMAQKQKIQSTNPTQLIQFIFKVINIKDKILKDFIRSVVYRKLLLCKDLSIDQSGFVHSEKKAINKLIQTYELDKNYVPPRPQFSQISFIRDGLLGYWNINNLQNQTTAMSELLNIMSFQIEEVFSIIRNYSNLNQEQRNKEQIKRNDKQVLSLRQKIDQMSKQYQLLQKKYRQAVSKDQKIDMIELKEKLRIAEQTIQYKELQIKQIRFQSRDSSTQIETLKQKVSQLTSDLEKLTKQQLVKLKDLQNIQKNLTLEFARLYKSVNSFGNIFEFQNDGKKSLAKQIISKKQAIQKMAGMLCKQKQKNQELQVEIARLNEIILELGKRIKMKRIQQSSLN